MVLLIIVNTVKEGALYTVKVVLTQLLLVRLLARLYTAPQGWYNTIRLHGKAVAVATAVLVVIATRNNTCQLLLASVAPGWIRRYKKAIQLAGCCCHWLLIK